VANYAHILNAKARIFRPGVVDVSVLPPIPTAGLTAADADKLTQRTRDAMMNELVRLSHLRPYEDGAAVATGVDGGSEARRKVRAGL